MWPTAKDIVSLILLIWCQSESILTPKFSKLVVVDFGSFFTEESGVHESTTLTLLNEHNRDVGCISTARADKLLTLTETLIVELQDFKEITLGHMVKFPVSKDLKKFSKIWIYIMWS